MRGLRPLFMVVVLPSALLAPVSAQADSCPFILGFATLEQLIPQLEWDRGFLHADFTPKPAYTVYQQFIKTQSGSGH